MFWTHGGTSHNEAVTSLGLVKVCVIAPWSQRKHVFFRYRAEFLSRKSLGARVNLKRIVGAKYDMHNLLW